MKQASPLGSWLLIGVGTHLAASVIVGFALGYAIDRWLGSAPWGMLLLGALGLIGGALKAHRMLSKLG